MNRRMLLLIPLLLVLGCTKVYNGQVDGSNGNGGGVTPDPVVTSHNVEFRVMGDVTLATITTSDTKEGREVIVTELPWFKSLKLTKSTFLYLSAVSGDYGNLHVMIYVDGELFREAYSVTGATPTITISGNYYF